MSAESEIGAQVSTGQPAQLKQGAVGIMDAIVMSCSFIAPAVGLMFGNYAIAIWVGRALPTVYIASMIMIAASAYSIGQLARKFPSAGALYTYSSRSMGPTGGFMTGWLIFSGSALMPCAIVSLFGNFTHYVLAQHGVNIPWPVLSLGAIAVVFILAYVGINLSMKTGLVMLVFQCLVLGILSIIILAKGGAGGSSVNLKPFVPMPGFRGWSGIATGLVFGIWAFVGFEAAATLGDEIRNPRRSIGRAVIGSALVLGVFYIFVSYAESVGFGTGAAGAHAISADTAGFDTLAKLYSGGTMQVFVDVAGIISLFALVLVGINAGSRIIFAMGREKLLPAYLGGTSKRFKTPGPAVVVLSSVTAAVSTIACIIWGTENAFAYIAFIATLSLVCVYTLANVAAMIVYRRDFRPEWNIWKHVIVPLVGIAGLMWVLKGNVYPIPKWPYTLFIYLVIAYIIAGFIVVYVLSRTPGRLAEAGKTLAGVEEEDQDEVSGSTAAVGVTL